MRQELTETLYHLLWELVHVFFEHRGLLEGRDARQVHDAGASSFLYPFLGEQETDLEAVIADVAASVAMKAEEVGALREQTLLEGRETLHAAAGELRARFDAGGTLLALGNGGSATDAMDVVADFRAPPAERGWPPRRALDLTEDPAIITALANDIGTDAIFSRQVIAYGGPGDALIALSTSGNSGSVIAALVEARRRGLATIALVGYGGGRVAAEGLADHVIVTRSEHIPRIQEAQASAYHVLRELVEAAMRRVRARVEGRFRASASGPSSTAWRSELDLAGYVLNDERGVLLEVEGGETAVDGFLRRLAEEAPPLAAIEAVRPREVAPAGERGFRILASPRGGEPAAPVSPDTATCEDCLAELFDPSDRRYRYPFVNCTNCGPRFTIVRGVPYDRPLTTMAGVRAVPALRGRVRRPGRPALPRPAERVPGVRPDAAAAAGRRLRRRGAARRRRGAARGPDRRGQGHRRLPPRLPGGATRPRSPRCARASTARTSRSR